jgi:hypothetical protein
MSLALKIAGAGLNGSIRTVDNQLECAICGHSLGSREMARYILIMGDC